MCSIGFGQDQYRMQFDLSLHSTMFGGTRSFENVSRTTYSTLSYYDWEEYSIDYKNFRFSGGLKIGFGFNWINSKNTILRQSISVFADIYNELITYELTDYQDDDSINMSPFPGQQTTYEIGDSYQANLNGMGLGLINDLIYMRKLENGWNIGGGIAFNIIRRNDAVYKYYSSVYGPNSAALGWGRYTTKQLGLLFRIEKSFNRWNIFLNLNQAVLTTKKEEKKGGDYYPESDKTHPISHNLDYRFPLMINFGTAVQFGKVKK